ncbi:MAG: recJ [Dehalococcoidia bacterium]|nr:recJ [Dehalococcoidia bacterium]
MVTIANAGGTRAASPKRAWHVLPRATKDELQAVGGHPLIAQLLFNRGMRTATEAQGFFQPQVDIGDPFLLPDAAPAVRRLARAIRAKEQIGIFGDFDADGVTSAAVLTEALRGLGASPIAYIPDRVAEGHGLNLSAIQYLRERGVSLVVTADCGIGSPGEVAAASEFGIDTIITDHHLPPARLPDAVAVVNPKLSHGDPRYTDLASVGVASRLMDALYGEMGQTPDQSLLEFVALGTIADLAPMHGAANRSLVRQGLQQLNTTKRPGILELLKVAHLQPGQVDTESIAYALGPRINAPGRLDHATPSYQLLVARSSAEAAPLAAVLDARNTERQRLTREILQKVKAALEMPLPPILVLGSPEFPAGIVGLAAGKLTEEFHRPSVVCEVGPEETRGSCRSIPEFNIVQALRQCEDLFTRYGGHAQAAGFSMPTRNFPLLRQRLLQIAEASLKPESLTPRLVIDAELPLDRINSDVIRGMRDFAPYGQQNPSPVFLSRRIEVRETRPMGAEGQHTRLKLRAGSITWDAVAFDTGEGTKLPTGWVDLVYTLHVDRWGGQSTLQMRALDMAATG